MGTYIIAEAGVNHNGSYGLATELVDIAVECGADAIKFQTFNTEALVLQGAQKADYQKAASDSEESQYDMLKRLELSTSEFQGLAEYARGKGIDFMSTAFDSRSLDFLVDELGVSTLKIPSGEITNLPFVLEHAQKNCHLIVSTGMATISEIRLALSVIAFANLAREIGYEKPDLEKFEKAYNSPGAIQRLRERVTLLHCTSAYPAPLSEINLAAMNHLAGEFGLEVGYSDHSEGIVVSIAAVARGAKVIEKHITSDKSLPGPDHSASLDPEELRQLVDRIRDVELAIGSEIKKPTDTEILNKRAARKSLYASKVIAEGEIFSKENISILRPEMGMEPAKYFELVGKKSSKLYKPGELLKE